MTLLIQCFCWYIINSLAQFKMQSFNCSVMIFISPFNVFYCSVLGTLRGYKIVTEAISIKVFYSHFRCFGNGPVFACCFVIKIVRPGDINTGLFNSITIDLHNSLLPVPHQAITYANTDSFTIGSAGLKTKLESNSIFLNKEHHKMPLLRGRTDFSGLNVSYNPSLDKYGGYISLDSVRNMNTIVGFLLPVVPVLDVYLWFGVKHAPNLDPCHLKFCSLSHIRVTRQKVL